MSPNIPAPSPQKKLRRSWCLWGVGIIILLLLSGGLYKASEYSSLGQGYSPNQPIPFSHQVHVEHLGLDCQYCHINTQSAQIGIPNDQICYDCHKHIKSPTKNLLPLDVSQNTLSPYYSGKPIMWKKVYRLPQNAQFPHNIHLTRQLDCSECHGDMKHEHKTVQKAPLTMKWCLDCHKTPSSTHSGSTAPTQCSTCHP